MGLTQIAGFLLSTLTNTINLSLKANYPIYRQQGDQTSQS